MAPFIARNAAQQKRVNLQKDNAKPHIALKCLLTTASQKPQAPTVASANVSRFYQIKQLWEQLELKIINKALTEPTSNF